MYRGTRQYCQWQVERIPPPNLSEKEKCNFLSSLRHRAKLILTKGITSFGRINTNKVQLDSSLTSRRHCSITLKEDGSLFIRDHQSLNGTFLHGKQILIEREISLGDGDVIGLGVDTSMTELNPQHPPRELYIFKITRNILPKEELQRCDPETIVPLLDDSGFTYRNVPSASSCASIELPTTSSYARVGIPSPSIGSDVEILSSTGHKDIQRPSISGSAGQEGPSTSSDRTKQNRKDYPNVQPMKNIKPEVEVIELSEDSGDEDENSKVTPIVVPDNESEHSPDNVISIDCDNDLPVSESLEDLHSKAESSTTKKVRANENNEISDDDLVEVVEIESDRYNKKAGNDDSTIVTESPISSVDSEEKKVVRSRNDNDREEGGLTSSPQNEKDKNSEEKKVVGLRNDNDREEGGSPQTEKDKNSGFSKAKESSQVEIKKEKMVVVDFTNEDDVILIEDDDAELPCSQLFDVKEYIQETNDTSEIDEPFADADDDKNVDIDCWNELDECNDSDSDSDAEQWFQRLSQSHDHYDIQEDKDKGKVNKNMRNNEPSVEDGERFDLHDKNQTLDKRMSDDDESGDLVSQLFVTNDSEAIFRKVPPARKRKLSDSSDDNNEDNSSRDVDTYEADTPHTSEAGKYLKQNQHEAEIHKTKMIICSSSEKKKHKKADELKINSTKHNKTSSHKKTASHPILNEGDNRHHGRSEKLTEMSLDSLSRNHSNFPSPTSKRVKKGQSKIKHERKRSTDTDSSQSSDTSYRSVKILKDDVHLTKDLKVTSDDEWNRILGNIYEHIDNFVDIHENRRQEGQSLNNKANCFATRTSLKPSKINKSCKPKVNSEPEEVSYIHPEDSCSRSENMRESKQWPVDKQFQSNSKTKIIPKTNENEKSSAVVHPIHEKSEVKKHADKVHPPSKTSKLSEVSKKINASHKRKTIPIIEAKSITKKRKSVISESENLMKRDDQTHENKNQQWFSNNKAKQSRTPLSKEDTKALRKEKLKDLAIKSALENKNQDKPKMFTAKNKTKSTSKSRNDMFVQDLVSSDTVLEKGEKPQKDLSSFKIPRRSSHIEDNTQTTEKSSSKESKRESMPQLSSAKTSDKEKDSKHLSKCSKTSLVEQILKSTATLQLPKDNKPQDKTFKQVVGVENEEPIKIIKLNEEEYNLRFKGNKSNITKQKSIIKLFTTPNNQRKKTKFNFVNDDRNVVYITVREYEVGEDSNLKPVTRSVSKEKDSDIKAKKPGVRKNENRQIINYKEETLYTVCHWNCSWLEEKNNIQKLRNGAPKDPPVFSGQLYHLTGEFSDYNDYRQGIFPLLIYELWGSVAKQYDMVYLKQNNRVNPLYNLDIRGSKTVKVTNVFIQRWKNPSLQHLHCQVLLDRKQQDVWPRPGDLVVLSLKFIQNQRIGPTGKMEILKGGERRIFGYVTDCPPPKLIEYYPDVSPKLRVQSPNANMVMNGLNIVIRGDRGQQIDIKEGARFKVLKNIKSDLRAFEALDHLQTSQLSRHIYQPRENCPRHKFDEIHAFHPLVNHLNESQKLTVLTIARECIEDSSMIHMVHGPPGCGKSEVIVNIILQMWFDYYTLHRTTEGFPQILLCTPSNNAIDDIVIKLVNRKKAVLDARGIPQFEVIRVASLQSSSKCSPHLTLDFMAREEMKRLNDFEDTEEKRIEIQCLEAKKHQLNQKLETLRLRTRSDKAKTASMLNEITDVEKKLGETKKRIKYLECGKQKPDAREMAAKLKETQLELLQKATVVATTLTSCYNGIMSEAYCKRFIKFDCCIVDEATQCTEPDTLIPLMLGVRKMVLVGDPRQLPATVLTTTAKIHGLEKSLFSRHYDWWAKQEVKHPCHFLNTQYRMHPEIAKWPSKYFYKGKLKNSEFLVDRIPNCPLVPYVVLSHSYLQSAEEGECNVQEGMLVATLVRGITSHPHCKGLNIGIITPYNRQKEELKNRINQQDFPNVEIGTVDSYQGREQDVVIFSCVRTEGVGFLGGPERLNVALTRAKHCLLVVGNFMSLQMDETWKLLLEDAKNRNVLKSIDNNQSIMSLILKPGQ